MMKKILVVVGHTGAGKSTICKNISDMYNIPLISFASAGKDFSNNLGYKRIRECYKEIGVEKFKKEFSEFFFNCITDHITKCDALIIDGLYIDDVADICKQNYSTLFVYIDVPKEICVRRVSERMHTSENVYSEYSLKEDLKEHLGNDAVIANADAIIDGTKDREIVLRDMLDLDFVSSFIRSR